MDPQGGPRLRDDPIAAASWPSESGSEDSFVVSVFCRADIVNLRSITEDRAVARWRESARAPAPLSSARLPATAFNDNDNRAR